MEYRCAKCNRGFKKEKHFNDHLQSIGHAQRTQLHCSICNKCFVNQQALNQHSSSKVHDVCTQFRCCDCHRDFVDEQALTEHLRDKIRKPKQPRENVPCSLCGKLFNSTKAMNMHKASPAHKPLCAPLHCIGSNGCGKQFNSPSSMILHLESGSCPSGITRRKLNTVIAQQDPKHLITSSTALGSTESIGGSCVNSEDGGVILTPSSSSPSLLPRNNSWSSFSTSWETPTPVELSLSFSLSEEMTLHRDDIPDITHVTPSPLFLCPLCPPTSNRFRKARDLENHSRSPAHAPKIFHCPVALPGSSKKKLAEKCFSTLSGLAMHVESGACGKKMFREVVQFVNERLKDVGIREIRLVK